MRSEVVFTKPLIVFLVVVGLVLLRAADDRAGPREPRQVLAVLAAGDLEGEERRELLPRVVSAAVGRSERELLLPAAMAAVALGDAEAYRDLCARAAGAVPVPVHSEDGDLLPLAALGDPLLANLLGAMLAEVQGRVDDARRRYGQVLAASRLWHSPLCARIACEGLERLG